MFNLHKSSVRETARLVRSEAGKTMPGTGKTCGLSSSGLDVRGDEGVSREWEYMMSVSLLDDTGPVFRAAFQSATQGEAMQLNCGQSPSDSPPSILMQPPAHDLHTKL